MILVVTGSRDITDPAAFEAAVKEALGETLPDALYHGGATGIDTLADGWARKHGIEPTPFSVTREEWNRYGKAAGPMRNQKMLDYAVATGYPVSVLAIPCPKSRGTWDCVRKAEAMGLPVFVYRGLL